MHAEKIIDTVSKFIRECLAEKLSLYLTFHNINHAYTLQNLLNHLKIKQ